tara:strand:- start:75 stop:455 length:381 start_codon:yes stop_codon:yes gene_type:complete
MRFGESVWNGVFVFVNVFRIEGGWRPPDDDDDDDDDDAFFSSPSKNSSSSHHTVGAQQMHDGPEKDKSFFEAEKAPPPPVLSPDMSLFFRSKSVVLSVLRSHLKKSRENIQRRRRFKDDEKRCYQQ